MKGFLQRKMNYINRLKHMINENMLVRETSLNELHIYFYIDDSTIDPEIYYKMQQEDRQFHVFRIIRGKEEKVATFHEEKPACLFMGIFVLFDGEFLSVPNELLEIDECEENNLFYLKNIVLKYIDQKYFSINTTSRNAICIIKDKIYRILFVDYHGEEHLISEDEDFSRGIGIMANYAWMLQYISNQMKKWRIKWDEEVLNVVKELLDVV